MAVRLRLAETVEDLESARRLIVEYVEGLGIDLSFQAVDAELAGLPGDYAPPGGCLILAGQGSGVGGCVAIRRMAADVCEMKRLYVRADFRGLGLGRRLAMRALEEARRLGYRRVRLDTLPSMGAAIALYESLGFRDIPPYRFNPIVGSRFLELELRP